MAGTAMQQRDDLIACVLSSQHNVLKVLGFDIVAAGVIELMKSLADAFAL
jgi:hypothetical protein